MPEPLTAPAARKDLEESASALLDAIVRAEVELHALQERCGSLELAITLGREAVDTLGSLPSENDPAKGNSGNVPAPDEGPAEETAGSPRAAAPDTRDGSRVTAPPADGKPTITPPKPLIIRRPQPAEQAEPVLEPVGAKADPVTETLEAPVTAQADPEPTAPAKVQSDAVSRSLEEQAAALRAAMGEGSTPAGEEPAANRRVPETSTPKATSSARPEPQPDPAEPERRAFQPKRSTPLKSRLAGIDVTAAPTDGESYSERSAELEQLLRTRDEG